MGLLRCVCASAPFEDGVVARARHRLRQRPDVATAHYSTGARRIEVYCEATPMLLMLLAGNRSFGWYLGTAAGQRFIDIQHD
jgi:hypothetical protein